VTYPFDKVRREGGREGLVGVLLSSSKEGGREGGREGWVCNKCCSLSSFYSGHHSRIQWCDVSFKVRRERGREGGREGRTKGFVTGELYPHPASLPPFLPQDKSLATNFDIWSMDPVKGCPAYISARSGMFERNQEVRNSSLPPSLPPFFPSFTD